MDTEEKVAPKKRPYTKPRLRTIELVAEEVMAVGGKMPQAAGPLAHRHNCMAGGGCFTRGS